MSAVMPSAGAPDNPIGFQLTQKVSELKSAILSRHPTMPTLLQDIHRTLKQYPECVTLMSPEEIATVVNGLENQTQTFLAQSIAAKSKGGGSKSLASKIANLGDDAL